MRTDPTGQYGVGEVIGALIIAWIYNAGATASDIKDNGGSYSTGFAYGLANPTVSIGFHYDSNGNIGVGPQPETTMSASPDLGYEPQGFDDPAQRYYPVTVDIIDISSIDLSDMPLIASNDPNFARQAADQLHERKEYRSPEYLRMLVPGQISFDNGVTAWMNGEHLASVGWFSMMVLEDVMCAWSFGQGQAASSGMSVAASGTGKTGVNILGKGSTGRTVANNLKEQLAMKEVTSNPLVGAKKVPLKMTDARWPESNGWVKMSKIVNDIEIHFNYNIKTGAFDDFKFK